MSSLRKVECGICECSLDKNGEEVTTECGHTFHRACAHKRIIETKKVDCRVCHKESALANALYQAQTTTTGKVTGQNPDPSEKENNDSPGGYGASVATNSWQCEHCSESNDASIKRCDSCGEPRNAISSSSDSATGHAAVDNEDEYGQAASFTGDNKNNSYKALESKHKSYHASDFSSDDMPDYAWDQPSRPDSGTSTTSKQEGKPIEITAIHISSMKAKPSKEATDLLIRSRPPSPPSSETIVYIFISDLSLDNENEIELARVIRHRVEDILQVRPTDVKYYLKLGVGCIRVSNNQDKDRLVNVVGKITLYPSGGAAMITFTDTLELVSYIVVNVMNDKKDVILPTSKEVSHRWAELCKGEEMRECNQLNVQFPNIYRIVSTSIDALLDAMSIQNFAIKEHLFARVYFCADCSFLEDLPQSITEDQLREAIGNTIGQSNISPSHLYINLNKQARNACIIALDDTARKWATNTFLYIGDKPISKKEKLPCRLLLHPVPQTFAVDAILKHAIFARKAKIFKHHRENLVLEISDKDVFDNCVKLAALGVGEKHICHMKICTVLSNPEESEIDTDTWYEGDMLEYKPDIMQFVADLEHPIFHYKWNAKIWLEQFNRTAAQNHGNNNNNAKSGDQIRHLLRVTVMLNTIAAIRKKSYMIGDREVKLDMDRKLKTIVYNHHSKLERGGPMPITRAPYDETKVKVVNKDCFIVYEECTEEYKKPLLLNMASATSAGGGYRKGDGAQEENLFRRSDYFRSLDIGLDNIQEQPPQRFRCSSTGDVDSSFDPKTMYPMDEYGAIYTSGLTVFRQPENKGYAYMEKPLTGVHSLAMAAYRNPQLDGKKLALNYAVGMRKKIENIFAIAYHHKHDCLVLSALGCGAFSNPPDHVAQIFRSVIDQYAGFFKFIIFAIVDDHNTGKQINPDGNFIPFQRELDGKVMKPITPMNHPNTMFGPYRLGSDGSKVHDIAIFYMPPCKFGAKCTDMYDSKHANEFSHPPFCAQACLTGMCTQTKDNVHMTTFVHRQPCKHGTECHDIDDVKHAQEFEHPSYCSEGGNCQNTTDEHEKAYRHLPMCKYSKKCMEFRTHVTAHCNTYRHCTPRCAHGSYCVNFHDRKHTEEYEHPFPTPCPFTPYHCALHEEQTQTSENRKPSHRVQQHCLDFAHVCQFGRNCTDTDPLHLETSIHVPRSICPFGDKCRKLGQEDHLNSFTHPHIRDIRLSCKHADQCHDRRKLEHIAKFRHTMTFEDSGVVRYYNLNKNTNFVRNQKDNIARVTSYVQNEKWKPLPSGSIPEEILDWIRTVQPVHRCNPEIFESIILHGHVMSREYMEHLKKPKFVANSVLQHSRIRRIEPLKLKACAQHAREYITALVTHEYKKNGFLHGHEHDEISTPDGSSSHAESKVIQREEVFLSHNIHAKDMEAIKTKAIEIAQASIKLHSNPAGIGYEPDTKLGTNKSVFSIIGPHLGYYYGDVVIIFKREILHHPDANFTMQAATSYVSGHAFNWRPWLGADPTSENERVKLYHASKLHASVPGYDYAAALELIAVTSHKLHKKTMDVDLKMILERWLKVDSHQTIEGHLPQLIPLEYIDHIFMTQTIYDSLNANTHRAIKAVFGHRTTITPHKKSDEYNKFVVEELIKRFGPSDTRSIARPIRGTVITIPSTELNDHLVLPLTISQAYAQYRIDHPKSSTHNTAYIYWQAMNGDMMLTLSNEQIDPSEKQPNLRCLICYVAEKPSSSETHYHEQASYLNSGRPSQHEVFITKGKYADKSTAFYVGCNTDDFMTFCLEIQRSTGRVTLSHAGSNSIYNHKTISCTFAPTELDLAKLEFVHVSAGTRTVPIRNLIITFEKLTDLHPTFDKDFKKSSSSSAVAASADAHGKKGHADHHASTPKVADDKPEKSGGVLNQLKEQAIQAKDKVKDFFMGEDSSPQQEDQAQKKNNDRTPCKWGAQCHNHDSDHRAKFSHSSKDSAQKQHNDLTPCKWGAQCHNHDSDHRAKFSHSSKDGAQKQHNDRTPCKWGDQCHNHDSDHRAKFSHSSKDSAQKQHNDRTPCKWGAQCHNHDSDHRAKFSHSSAK